ncbi:MAG TPA: type 1 glutamine amidotransferase domain-containing protein [Geobacterales bacterium]|nr:type 1 glutamine amidotransferase domain-containing protein [Geobacterales bacterium]
MKVLFLLGEGFEDLEFYYPYYRLIEEGFEVVVAGKSKSKVSGKHGYTFEPNITFDNVRPEEYDALVIPGGKSPANIREDPNVQKIVKFFMEKSKPVAAICHGPQVLISAGVVKGRKLTSWFEVSKEITAAGGQYVNTEVIIDGNLITSRHPGDLPYFSRELIKALKKKAVEVTA